MRVWRKESPGDGSHSVCRNSRRGDGCRAEMLHSTEKAIPQSPPPLLIRLSDDPTPHACALKAYHPTPQPDAPTPPLPTLHRPPRPLPHPNGSPTTRNATSVLSAPSRISSARCVSRWEGGQQVSGASCCEGSQGGDLTTKHPHPPAPVPCALRPAPCKPSLCACIGCRAWCTEHRAQAGLPYQRFGTGAGCMRGMVLYVWAQAPRASQ